MIFLEYGEKQIWYIYNKTRSRRVKLKGVQLQNHSRQTNYKKEFIFVSHYPHKSKASFFFIPKEDKPYKNPPILISSIYMWYINDQTLIDKVIM